MIDSEMIVKLTFNRSLDLLRKIGQQNVSIIKKNEHQKAAKYNLANSSLNKRYIGILSF